MTNEPHTYRVGMTPAQSGWAKWAIDPMPDYWEEQAGPSGSNDGRIPKAFPYVEGRTLVIPADPMQEDMIEDFLFRLEEQGMEIAYDDCRPQSAAAARRLAGKIRDAVREQQKN